MRTWLSYLLGLTLVAIAAFGAYQAYALAHQSNNACASAVPVSAPDGNYRHAPLRA